MEAIDFVEKLAELYKDETLKHMKNNGFPDELIDEYRQSLFFHKRDNRYLSSHDPLIDLVTNYDGSKVHIGMLSFDLDPFEDESYYFFAGFDGDVLGIDKNLKEIRMIEYGTDNHILYNCANSSANFMYAILMVADIVQKCNYDDTFDCNERLLTLLAGECAERAGDENRYVNFYKMLLGCD